jgi:hypothetical protein
MKDRIHETNESSIGPRKGSRLLRALKWGGALSLVAIVFLFSWYSIWKSSGSGQWEFNRGGEGVVVHTMKVPGDPLVKVKGVGRLQSSLAGIFKLMRDAESCMDAGCYDASIFKTVDYPHVVYYKFTYPLFFPFKDREYVVVSEFTQDPETKELRVDYLAVPDALPPDDCCVRITHMHNKWRFTPLDNGEIETEFELDTSSGGFFPDLIISLGAPGLVHWAIQDFQRILDQDRYRNAPAEYVLEVGQSHAPAPSAYVETN